MGVHSPLPVSLLCVCWLWIAHRARSESPRHAETMLNIISRAAEPRVDQYLFLFLKFMTTCCPSISFDFTFEVETSGKK